MPDDQSAYAPHIPDAVRRASERADELAREAGVLNVPPLPEGETTTVVAEPEQQPPEQPQGELFGDLAPRELPTQEPRESRSEWEQRYNTLQGKYNSELAELRGQLRANQDLLAQMQQQMLRAPPAQPEPQTRENTFSLPRRDPPPEDTEAYGSDLINGVQRWSRLELEPELVAMRQRIIQLESGVQYQASMTATQRVDAALDREVPNWRSLNVDQNFIAWLNQVDPFSGQTRKVLADGAYAAGDAPRTIAFFNAYTNEHTAVRQAPGTQPVQTGDPADRLPLADLAVPGRGATAAPPTPGAPQRRIWTGADINSFYRQKQRGMWNGREAEVARIEADIFAAGHEGRIRQ